MAKKKEERKRGLFEFPVEFVPRSGGEAAEVWMTPSDWALADEWVDELRAAGLREAVVEVDDPDNPGQKTLEPRLVNVHTEAWLKAKFADAAYLLAAQRAGLMRPGPIDLGRIAEMNNVYEVREAAEAEAEGGDADGGNPTAGGEGA